MNRLFFFLCCVVLASNLDAATLSGYFVPRDAASNVDLTSVGPVDWIHSGLDSTNSNRKGNVASRISEISFIGAAPAQAVTNSVGFSWSDGFPTPAAANVLSSAGVTNLTNGFSVQIPVSTTVSKLKIYLGAFAALGQLNISLDELTPPLTTVLDSSAEINGYYFVEVIADKNNDVLTITYTAASLYDTNAFVSLQAVALTTNANPTVALSGIANDENLLLGSTTLLTANPFDSDGSITNVDFLVNGVKVGQAVSAPYECLWTNTIVGPHTVTAVATDHNGAQGNSLPVSLFVTSNNGAMISALAVAPNSVNLTTEGTSDWVHWGLHTGNSVNRKAGVGAQIGNLSLIGSEPAYNYSDNTTVFNWTDGTPILSTTPTPTGIYVVGVGNGFQLTVPADMNPRTLKLYVGAFGARGRFTATLSDYSAPVFVNRSINHFGNGDASVFTLSYAAASSGKTLTVTFTCDQRYDPYGNVTFQAATLVSAVNPLHVSLTSPTNTAVFASPANIQLQANLSGENGEQRTVEFYNGLTKLGEATSSPYLFNWNSVPTGEYTVVAKATNSLGMIQSSEPIRIFVTGTGGTLVPAFNTSSGNVDLTANGSIDWVHWGLIRKNSLNRKANILPQISNFIEIGKGRIDQYSDNPVSFSWTDGTPNLAIGGSTTGVFKNEEGNGYEITVPADNKLRRLKLYVGLYGARGAFEAVLSDLSAPPFLHSSFQNVYNNAAAVYTIEYAAASPGQTLTLRYISKTLFDIDYGNVTLQAATLSDITPKISSFAAVPASTGFNFSTEVGWNYTVESTATLSPPNWQPIANYAGTGSNIAFIDPVSPTTNRFYRVRMSR